MRTLGIETALLQEIPASGVRVILPVDLGRDIVTIEARHEVFIDDSPEARNQRVDCRVGWDAGRVGEDLLPSDEPRVCTQLDDVFKEAAEDGKANTLP